MSGFLTSSAELSRWREEEEKNRDVVYLCWIWGVVSPRRLLRYGSCYQNGGSKLDHPVRKKSSFAWHLWIGPLSGNAVWDHRPHRGQIMQKIVKTFPSWYSSRLSFFWFSLYKYFLQNANFFKYKIRPPLVIFSAFLKKNTMTNSSANFLSPEPNGQGLYFSELKYHGAHTYNFQNLTLQCNTLMIFLSSSRVARLRFYVLLLSLSCLVQSNFVP